MPGLRLDSEKTKLEYSRIRLSKHVSPLNIFEFTMPLLLIVSKYIVEEKLYAIAYQVSLYGVLFH